MANGSAFTLANEALKLFGNPRAFYSDATHVFEVDPPKKIMREFARECSQLHHELQQSAKFVWSEPFSALVAETTEQSPATFLKLWATARPPFEDCWIEWKSAVQSRDEISIGAWIRRRHGTYSLGGDGENDYPINDYEVMIVTRLSKRAADRGAVPLERVEKTGLIPVGLFMDFEQSYRPTADEIADSSQLNWFWTSEYQQRWHRQMAMLEQLAFYIGPVFVVPPFHLFGRPPNASKQEAVEQEGRIIASFVMVELVCGLALMTTHLGGGAPIEYHAGQTKRQYYGGKYHPATEYQLVRMVRPMTARQLIRRTLRNYRIERNLPEYPVVAAWHHRREAVDNCRVHPRACPLAEWSQLYDDKGEQLGSQLQECTICGRRRWHQRGHTRGNAAFGVVHKDYEIVTHKHRKVILHGPDHPPSAR